MEGIGLLFFIILIVASLIEQASKAGKKGKPGQGPAERRPPRGWPGAELPGPRGRLPGQERPREARPGREPVPLPDLAQGETSAADMVAEDFWRELTGQPPRPRPVPPPVGEPAEAAESWDEIAVRSTEAPPPETAPSSRPSSWDYRRPETVHEAPVIVSLETPIVEPEARRAAYHRRLDSMSKPASVEQQPTNQLLRRLRRREGLRESVIMAEVFGTPRGLEELSRRG